MVASTASPVPSTPVTQLTEQASAWRGVTLAPRPDRAVAFRLDDATIGILAHDGVLEVPIPAPIRTVLVEEDLAQSHTTRTGKNWVAVHVRSSDDVNAAALLLRLSYLYRRLLRSQNGTTLRRIRLELAQYALPDALGTLYETMLDKRDLPDSSVLPDAPPSE